MAGARQRSDTHERGGCRNRDHRRWTIAHGSTALGARVLGRLTDHLRADHGTACLPRAPPTRAGHADPGPRARFLPGQGAARSLRLHLCRRVRAPVQRHQHPPVTQSVRPEPDSSGDTLLPGAGSDHGHPRLARRHVDVPRRSGGYRVRARDPHARALPPVRERHRVRAHRQRRGCSLRGQPALPVLHGSVLL